MSEKDIILLCICVYLVIGWAVIYLTDWTMPKHLKDKEMDDDTI